MAREEEEVTAVAGEGTRAEGEVKVPRWWGAVGKMASLVRHRWKI